MSARYEEARRVALGLVREQAVQPGDDIWNISLGDGFGQGGGFGLSAEMPYQFFEKGFEAPEEQSAQKAALMLYDEEYREDRKAAEDRLERLKASLKAGDTKKLEALLEEAPLEEWLSLIFLEGESLQEGLVPLLDQADEGSKALFSQALDGALERLVEFRNLLQGLRERC